MYSLHQPQAFNIIDFHGIFILPGHLRLFFIPRSCYCVYSGQRLALFSPFHIIRPLMLNAATRTCTISVEEKKVRVLLNNPIPHSTKTTPSCENYFRIGSFFLIIPIFQILSLEIITLPCAWQSHASETLKLKRSKQKLSYFASKERAFNRNGVF